MKSFSAVPVDEGFSPCAQTRSGATDLACGTVDGKMSQPASDGAAAFPNLFKRRPLVFERLCSKRRLRSRNIALQITGKKLSCERKSEAFQFTLRHHVRSLPMTDLAEPRVPSSPFSGWRGRPGEASLAKVNATVRNAKLVLDFFTGA